MLWETGNTLGGKNFSVNFMSTDSVEVEAIPIGGTRFDLFRDYPKKAMISHAMVHGQYDELNNDPLITKRFASAQTGCRFDYIMLKNDKKDETVVMHLNFTSLNNYKIAGDHADSGNSL